MIEIVSATPSQMPLVKSLFTEYQEWLGIDLCFQNFEQELASLPGCYAAPKGIILLAMQGEEAVGCVAIRPHQSLEAELKRLYVRDNCRKQGVGKRLFIQAMDFAQNAGYHSVVLDTLPSMTAAARLYREYGFKPIESYYDNPLDGVVYYQHQFEAKPQ
jgi:ribosomal protein S18 acetylase RimI-like enzyme